MSLFDKTKLIDRLPAVRGRYRENVNIGETTWFRAGGSAEIVYKPADREDLAAFLAGCPVDIPVTVLGVCSNVIIRDGGLPGVVIRLGRDFAEIEVNEQTGEVSAGAAALDINVASEAARLGRGGLEFLSGIPGTVGGALRMNAGAYGAEIVDHLIEVEVLDREGHIRRYKPDQMQMSYRSSGIPENFIFTQAVLATTKEDHAIIEDRMAVIREKRATTQPIKARTGGSTFANPSAEQLRKAGLPEDTKAWTLIDRVGARGLMVGGAQMSELHCNFMINTGEASAADLENLGDEVRRRVLEQTGIELRWEIKRIGLKRPDLGQMGIVGNA